MPDPRLLEKPKAISLARTAGFWPNQKGTLSFRNPGVIEIAKKESQGPRPSASFLIPENYRHSTILGKVHKQMW